MPHQRNRVPQEPTPLAVLEKEQANLRFEAQKKVDELFNASPSKISDEELAAAGIKNDAQKKVDELFDASPSKISDEELAAAGIKKDVEDIAVYDKVIAEEKSKGSETGKERKIDCPVCGAGKRKQMTNDVPKPAKSDAGNSRFRSTALKKISAGIGDVAQLLKLGSSSERTKITQSILGKCPRCGNKNKIKDPTDRSKQQEAAAKKAEALQEQILQTEAEMGPPGGNDLKIVVGDKHLEVGFRL